MKNDQSLCYRGKGRCYWLKGKGWNFDLSKQFLMVQIIRATELHTAFPRPGLWGWWPMCAGSWAAPPVKWEPSPEQHLETWKIRGVKLEPWQCHPGAAGGWAALPVQPLAHCWTHSSLHRENAQGMLILIFKGFVTRRKGATSTLR